MKKVESKTEEVPEVQDLSMESVMELQPDANGQIKLTQEEMEAMMAEQAQKNPYTHVINFDNVIDCEDIVAVLKSLQISIDPAQWGQDSKYIKLKGE